MNIFSSRNRDQQQSAPEAANTRPFMKAWGSGTLLPTGRSPFSAAVFAVAAWLLLAMNGGDVVAQHNPVYVDDSPRGRELFQQARDQAQDNPSEAARLYQELLDDYGDRLIIARPGVDDHYVSIRQRVIDAMLSDETVLQRYQLINTAEAERLLEQGRLEHLALTRPLTAPGLEAMLQLGQQALEEGRFYTAIDWLSQARQHPDLTATEQGHALYMLGLAGHYADRRDVTANALDGLEEVEGGATSGLHDALAAALQTTRPHRRTAVNLLQQAQVSDLNDLVDDAIWSVELDSTLIRHRFRNASDVREREMEQQLQRDATLATVAATADHTAVYVNEGARIRAFDRFNGEQLWEYGPDRFGSAVEDSEQPFDLSMIAVVGDTLVTLTGFAHPDRRTGDGLVVCLNAATGERRWERSLQRLDVQDEFADFFPYGSPIIMGDAVYLLVRKITRQQLVGTYVVAMDIADGQVRWTRYISAAGGLRRASRPVSSLIEHGGSLFVATSVGGIARVDPTTGMIDWLRRYSVPINLSYRDQAHRPWEFATPAVTDRGVVAVTADRSRVVLIDSDTGEEIRSMPTGGDAWERPRYLLAQDDLVIAVGQEIRAYHVDDLSTPLWQLPAERQQSILQPETSEGGAVVDDPRRPQRLVIRGRVQSVDGALVVPTGESVLIVDTETGVVQQTLAISPGGNPLAVEAQLFLASSDRLAAYMSFTRAREMLLVRLDEQPDDPDAALSLIRLGMRGGDVELAMQATDRTMEIIERLGNSARAAATRRELFHLLLELHESGLVEDRQRGEMFFERMAAVAHNPRQRVEHLLSYARWVSQFDPAAGVDHWQQLLSDHVLADVLHREDHLEKPAAAWAAADLARAIREHGEAIYRTYADEAAQAYEALAADPLADPAALAVIAREYPLAPAGVDAAVDAANRFAKAGEVRRAAAVLLDTYQLSQRTAAARQLLGEYVVLATRNDWDREAALAVQHVLEQFGNQQLRTAAGEKSADRWWDDLQQHVIPQLPALGRQQGEPEVYEGQIISSLEIAGADNSRYQRNRSDMMFVSVGSRVRAVGADLGTRWEADVDDSAPRLIHADRNQALFWLSSEPLAAAAVAVDVRSGEQQWVTPSIDELLPDPSGEGSRRVIRSQTPSGALFDPAESVPLTNSELLVIVNRSGGVVGLSRVDGTEPRWSRQATLDEVHLMRLSDHHLVLAGVRYASSDRNTNAAGQPTVIVIDPQTGRVRHQIHTTTGEPMRWMHLGSLGRIVVGTARGAETFDAFSGRTLWINHRPAMTESLLANAAGDLIVIEDQSGALRSLHVHTAELSSPFDLDVRGQWSPMELEGVSIDGSEVVAHYRQRVIRYDRLGNLIGADVITADRNYRWLLQTADGLVVISGQSEQDFRRERQTQYLYTVYQLTSDGRLIGNGLALEPLQRRVDTVDAIDGWLLLGLSSHTIAIPMPEGGAP